MTDPLKKDIREYPIEYQELNTAVNKIMKKYPDVSVYFFVTAEPASKNKLRSLSGGGFVSPRHLAMLAHGVSDMINDAANSWKVPQLLMLSKLIVKAVDFTFGAKISDSTAINTDGKEH